VRIFIGQHVLDDGHEASVDHLDRTRMTDRDVQAVRGRVVPDGVRLTRNVCARHLAIGREVQPDDNTGVTRHECPTHRRVDIQTMWTAGAGGDWPDSFMYLVLGIAQRIRGSRRRFHLLIREFRAPMECAVEVFLPIMTRGLPGQQPPAPTDSA
jgi:hypothetical protein